MTYKSYQDVRGEEARSLSQLMGVDEPANVTKNGGFLVELREAKDHFRISAHSASYFREVNLYHNRTVEEIDIDILKGEASKTIYAPDGTITTLKAPWNRNIGYRGEYIETGKETDRPEITHDKWESYDQALLAVQLKNGPRGV